VFGVPSYQDEREGCASTSEEDLGHMGLAHRDFN
jgi:hypothetical protein